MSNFPSLEEVLGLKYKGTWEPSKLYSKDDVVEQNGQFYVCINNNNGVALTNIEAWVLLKDHASISNSLGIANTATPDTVGLIRSNLPKVAPIAVTQPVAFTPPPPLAEWTWANQDLATAEDVPGGIRFTAPTSEFQPYVLLIGGDLPPAPYTIIAAFNVAINTGDQYGVGLTLYDPDSGKFKLYLILYESHFGNSNGAVEYVSYWNTPTTWSGTLASDDATTGIPYTPVIWFQLTDDGENVIFSLSYDGITYCVFSSTPNSEFISTASQHGLVLVETFQVSTQASEFSPLRPLVATLLSYQVTTP